MRKITKREALREFRSAIGTTLNSDVIAKREAWSNYTDSLCKDGLITEKQYREWTNPF